MPQRTQGTQRTRVVLVGEGAIARKHAAALQRIDDVEIATVVGGDAPVAERAMRDHLASVVDVLRQWEAYDGLL